VNSAALSGIFLTKIKATGDSPAGGHFMSASGLTSRSACRFICLLAMAVPMFPAACLAQSASSSSPINDNVVSVQELRSPGKLQKAFDKGAKLLLKGDAAASIAYFDRAIAKDPSYYRAYYDKGLAHFRLGHTTEAEQAFQKTIDVTRGGYAPADFLMGVILCQNAAVSAGRDGHPKRS
jgi:tetratricopeptide (TPR) repeat protein